MTYDVFLTYAPGGEPLAQSLQHALTQSGLTVYRVDRSLVEKEALYETIHANETIPMFLTNSRHCVVVWSEGVQRDRFVRTEYTYFHTEQANPPERMVVPVLVEGMSAGSLPGFLQDGPHFEAEGDLGALVRALGGDLMALEHARLKRRVRELERIVEAGDAEALVDAHKTLAEVKQENRALRAVEGERDRLEREVAEQRVTINALQGELDAVKKDHNAALARIEVLESQLKGQAHRKKPRSAQLARNLANLPETRTDAFGIDYVLIRPGGFSMGSEGWGARKNESPVNYVEIALPFYLGVYAVTQGQWEAVMGDNPSRIKKGETHPVEMVSWHDVQTFLGTCNRAGEAVYRLPTEAEWEYACRAGTKTEFATSGRVVCGRKLAKGHAPVGTKKANSWGLYDMHGNVWEWTQSMYRPYPYEPHDGRNDPGGSDPRTVRGGAFNRDTSFSRSASRRGHNPDEKHSFVGFRLVLMP